MKTNATISNAIAANVGAPPSFAVYIYWDAGVGWIEESAYLVSGSGESVLLTPDKGLMAIGSDSGNTCNLVMVNSDGRYSVKHSGSTAATFGIYGKPVAVYAGYSAQVEAIFVGRIVGVNESEREQQVTLTCQDDGNAAALQQKASTVMYTSKRTDEWIAILAGLAGLTSTSLERGLFTIPYCYLDDDYPYEEIRKAAMAEGGAAFINSSGTLCFWNAAHWCNAVSAATYTVASFADCQPVTDYNNVYNIIGVEYQPRLEGQATTVYKLKRTLIIPPSGTQTLKAKFSLPLASFTSYTLKANNSGGVDMSTSVTVSPTAPDSAASWNITLTNADTRQAAFVTRFDVLGTPVEGRPAESYEEDQSGSSTDKRRDVRGNWYVQTDAQARYTAKALAQRLKTPCMTMTLSAMMGNPLVELGDVVTVQATLTGVNTTAIVTGIKWTLSRAGYKTTLSLADFANFYAYTTYFKLGASALNSGRLFY